MKSLFFVVVLFSFGCSNILAQNYGTETYQINEPRKIFMNTHDPNLKSFPEKSFYQSRKDWQYIIDTTWGAGLPLAQKRLVFNTYTSNLDVQFSGFQSLGITQTSWDSLKDYYYSQINDSTSRGRFSSIMSYLCSKLRDGHTWCDDNVVWNTPLNPGVPFLMFSGLILNAQHLGAVTTVLPDSSVMVLRVVDNHPLNLEPGDIILGYEGVPWKDLIVELMEAELPNYDFWGGYSDTFTDNLFISAGMNWHLFDTMDILKYSTGDTVHLSVAPLVNLNLPSMINNEQIEIPNIPFPNYFNNEVVTYGILPNTNIGYIYVLSEYPSNADAQFNQAVISLQNTDALIIDLRWNEGGNALWNPAFNILTNETFYTVETADRCNYSTFDLCPTGDSTTFRISGSGGTYNDRPIAVLLGPNCFSNGELNAYRLRYLINVKTFGKPTFASLGYSTFPSISGWSARISTHDMFQTNNPGVYLNRREFPIDFPVWHNRDDVAHGKDAVVEKALDWINITDNRDATNDYNLPRAYALGQNFPNPFNPNTIIKYSIPKSSQATLKIFNTLGEELETLVNEEKPAGTYELTWNAANLPSGVYFYQLKVGSFIQTKKMLLVK